MDLDAVTLVDVEVIRFLNACEEGGIELLHCWPYIREWMAREQDGKRFSNMGQFFLNPFSIKQTFLFE